MITCRPKVPRANSQHVYLLVVLCRCKLLYVLFCAQTTGVITTLLVMNYMTIYLICDDAAQGLPRLVSTKVFKGERTSMTAETAKAVQQPHTPNTSLRSTPRAHALTTHYPCPPVPRRKTKKTSTADSRRENNDGRRGNDKNGVQQLQYKYKPFMGDVNLQIKRKKERTNSRVARV